MTRNPAHHATRKTTVTAGLVLLPILCCTLPLLIAAGALGAVGAVLCEPWVIAAAVLLPVGVVGRRLLRRRRTPVATGSDVPPTRLLHSDRG